MCHGWMRKPALAKAVCAAFEMRATMASWLTLRLELPPRWRSAVSLIEGKMVGGDFLDLERENL